MEKLKSRKLWIVIGTTVSAFAASAFGIDLSPEAIAGLAGVVMVYLGGQSWIDKAGTQEAVKAEGDVAKAQLLAYARRLEAELAAIQRDSAPESITPPIPENVVPISE